MRARLYLYAVVGLQMLGAYRKLDAGLLVDGVTNLAVAGAAVFLSTLTRKG